MTDETPIFSLFLCSLSLLARKKGSAKERAPVPFCPSDNLRFSGLPKIRNLKTGFSIGKPSGARKMAMGCPASPEFTVEV
jgi:hypothetical protein